MRFTSPLHHLLQGGLAHPLLPKGEEEEWLREQVILPKQLDTAPCPCEGDEEKADLVPALENPN